jgi:hypothetical protein
MYHRRRRQATAVALALAVIVRVQRMAGNQARKRQQVERFQLSIANNGLLKRVVICKRFCESVKRDDF